MSNAPVPLWIANARPVNTPDAVTENVARGREIPQIIVAEQREVIEFLSLPATHGSTDVERIETHAAVVFLADR